MPPKKQKSALPALWEIEQLRKPRSYMLIATNHYMDGIEEIHSLVGEDNETILNLHETAAFLLSEAASASFRRNQSATGKALAITALGHAGQARAVILNAIIAWGS